MTLSYADKLTNLHKLVAPMGPTDRLCYALRTLSAIEDSQFTALDGLTVATRITAFSKLLSTISLGPPERVSERAITHRIFGNGARPINGPFASRAVTKVFSGANLYVYPEEDGSLTLAGLGNTRLPDSPSLFDEFFAATIIVENLSINFITKKMFWELFQLATDPLPAGTEVITCENVQAKSWPLLVNGLRISAKLPRDDAEWSTAYSKIHTPIRLPVSVSSIAIGPIDPIVANAFIFDQDVAVALDLSAHCTMVPTISAAHTLRIVVDGLPDETVKFARHNFSIHSNKTTLFLNFKGRLSQYLRDDKSMLDVCVEMLARHAVEFSYIADLHGVKTDNCPVIYFDGSLPESALPANQAEANSADPLGIRPYKVVQQLLDNLSSVLNAKLNNLDTATHQTTRDRMIAVAKIFSTYSLNSLSSS